jgi:hypothetical protein
VPALAVAPSPLLVATVFPLAARLAAGSVKSQFVPHYSSRMNWQPQTILSILDGCCERGTFPMLDNGYVYPAAARLSLYRSPQDWAIVIEVFGFSPRSGIPDVHVHTFASQLQREKSAEDYVNHRAYETYLENNRHNESTFFYPIEGGDWQDSENEEIVAREPHPVLVRGHWVDMPALSDYTVHGIDLEDPKNVHVFEFCRLLAAVSRDSVLATAEERRRCVPRNLKQILQLEEWRHPDLLNHERPSANATFQSLAEVLVSGDIAAYQPPVQPNTHWKHWPDGGTL